MSFHFSPKIVNNGLVLYVDAANPKSFISGATTIYDLTLNNIDGLLTNGVTSNTNNKGTILLDGIDDYVDFKNSLNDVFSGVGKKFTFSSFFNPTSNGNQFLFGKYSDNGVFENGRQFGVFVRDLGTGFKVDVLYSPTLLSASVNLIRSTSVLTLNKPNYVVVTYDETQPTTLSKFNIYINGVLSAKSLEVAGGTGPIVTGPARLSLGSSVASTGVSQRAFQGEIYSFLIYNRDLSAVEILQNYNTLKSRFGI